MESDKAAPGRGKPSKTASSFSEPGFGFSRYRGRCAGCVRGLLRRSAVSGRPDVPDTDARVASMQSYVAAGQWLTTCLASESGHPSRMPEVLLAGHGETEWSTGTVSGCGAQCHVL